MSLMLMKLIAVIDYIGELFSYDGLNRLSGSAMTVRCS